MAQEHCSFVLKSQSKTAASGSAIKTRSQSNILPIFMRECGGGEGEENHRLKSIKSAVLKANQKNHHLFDIQA
jgi:hypothetical protein